MKCIVYAPTKELALKRQAEIVTQGHEVISIVNTHSQLIHVMAEFGANVVVVGPVDAKTSCRPGCIVNIFNFLVEEGHTAIITPQVWEASLPLCSPSRERSELIMEASVCFLNCGLNIPIGLECLPGAWLAGLPAVLVKLANSAPGGLLPAPLFSISANIGVVEISFLQDQALGPSLPGQNTWRAKIRRALNLSLYPTMWRPLKQTHWRQLYATRQDLRPFLEHQPWRP